MKTRQEEKEIDQLNMRVTKSAKTAVKAVSAMTGLKMEMIGYDAIRCFLGQTDPDIEKRRRDCQNAFKAYAAMERDDGSTTCLSYRSGRRLAIA